MAYNDRMKEARRLKGLTQAELGELVGCAKNTISGYENCVNDPSMTILSKIMDALGVDANFIFQDEMREHYECHATTEEMETLVKKYRQLDEHGKKLVLDFMNYTLEACKKTIVKTVIKFPQRAPAEKEPNKLENNTIDFPNMTPLKVSEQPSAAGLGVYLGPESFTEYMVQDNALIRRTAFAVPVSGDSMEPKFHDGDIALVNFEPAEPGDIVVVTMDGLGYIKKLGDGVLISLNKKYKPIPMKEDMRVNGKVIGILDPEWF